MKRTRIIPSHLFTDAQELNLEDVVIVHGEEEAMEFARHYTQVLFLHFDAVEFETLEDLYEKGSID